MPSANDDRSRSMNDQDPVGQAAIENHESQMAENDESSGDSESSED